MRWGNRDPEEIWVVGLEVELPKRRNSDVRQPQTDAAKDFLRVEKSNRRAGATRLCRRGSQTPNAPTK